MNKQFRSQIIKVGEHKVFSYSFVPANAQRTFVLVHGIGVSHRYFKRLAHELARTDAVYALDLPGYGNVYDSNIRLDINELSRVLEDFIVQNNLVTPVLIGHSMGCQIVTKLAVRSPGISKKLILLGPTINRYERWTPLQGLRLFQNALRDPLPITLVIIADYFRFGFWRYRWTARHMMNDAIEGRLPNIQVPTLVIRGQEDPIVRHEWVRHLVELLPQGQLEEVTCAGHVVQYSETKKVAELCRRFVCA